MMAVIDSLSISTVLLLSSKEPVFVFPFVYGAYSFEFVTGFRKLQSWTYPLTGGGL